LGGCIGCNASGPVAPGQQGAGQGAGQPPQAGGGSPGGPSQPGPTTPPPTQVAKAQPQGPPQSANSGCPGGLSEYKCQWPWKTEPDTLCMKPKDVASSTDDCTTHHGTIVQPPHPGV